MQEKYYLDDIGGAAIINWKIRLGRHRYSLNKHQSSNTNHITMWSTATTSAVSPLPPTTTALRWQQQQLNHIRLQIPDQKVQKNFSLKNDFEGRKREKTFPYDYAILIFRVRKKVKKGSWPPWNVPSLVSPLLLLLLVVQQVRSAANWDQRGWFKS